MSTKTERRSRSQTKITDGHKRNGVLAGRRFGKLKVLRLDKGTHHWGKRWWLCQCDCGKRCLVNTSALMTGETKSCGCLRGSSKRGRFTKARAQEAYSAAAKIQDGGKEWLSPKAAREHLEVSDVTLRKWADRCPWLDGQGIVTRPFTGAMNRTLTYYALSDLDLIRTEKAKRKPIPEYTGQVHLREAITEAGGHRYGLRKARPTGPILKPGKDSMGRATFRSYVPRAVVDGFKAARTPALGPDDITVAQAREILNCDRSRVKNLVYRGILKRVKKAVIPWAGKDQRTRRRVRAGGIVLSRSEVEAYQRSHVPGSSPVPVPASERLAPEGETPGAAPPPARRQRRGRPTGPLDKTQDKYRKIRNAFEAGERNKSALARRFNTSRRSVDRALEAQVRG